MIFLNDFIEADYTVEDDNDKQKDKEMDLCQYSKHIFSNFLYSFTSC